VSRSPSPLRRSVAVCVSFARHAGRRTPTASAGWRSLPPKRPRVPSLSAAVPFSDALPRSYISRMFGEAVDAPVRDLRSGCRRCDGVLDTRSVLPPPYGRRPDPGSPGPWRVSPKWHVLLAPGCSGVRDAMNPGPTSFLAGLQGHRPKSVPRPRTGSGLCSHARRAEARHTI
jgi:hypothetical protein